MDTNSIGNEIKEPEKKPPRQEKTRSEPLKSKKTEQLIYVGPNLAGGRLSRFTVFRDGIPKYLDDVIEKQPMIKNLIVPIGGMSKVMERIELTGTLENSAFQELSGKGVN